MKVLRDIAIFIQMHFMKINLLSQQKPYTYESSKTSSEVLHRLTQLSTKLF